MRDAIQERIETDYKEFEFVFTTDRPHPFEEEYSTIRFYYEGDARFGYPYASEPFQLFVPNCGSVVTDFVGDSGIPIVSVSVACTSIMTDDRSTPKPRI